MKTRWKKIFGAALVLALITWLPRIENLAHAQVADVWYVIIQNPNTTGIYQFVWLEQFATRSEAQDRAAFWRACNSNTFDVQAAHAIPAKAATTQMTAGVLDPAGYDPGQITCIK